MVDHRHVEWDGKTPRLRAQPERQCIPDRHGDRRQHENPTPAEEINAHSAQQG
jgi:hypothetical protein